MLDMAIARDTRRDLAPFDTPQRRRDGWGWPPALIWASDSLVVSKKEAAPDSDLIKQEKQADTGQV
jgi:hypothetical protein